MVIRGVLVLPASEGDTLGILLIRVQHAIKVGHVTLGVGNDWIGETSGQVIVGNDVLDEAIMRLHLITGQGDEFHPSFAELIG